jgi:hypothetical protein
MVPWVVADGTEVLIEWLTPLGETRDDRPTGAVLPYRMVHRIDGPFDGLVDKGVYSVHTLAGTKTQAQDEATLTQRRMEYLVSHGQQKVTLGNGREVQADNVATLEYPRTVKWADDIWDAVATYRVDLRITAA